MNCRKLFTISLLLSSSLFSTYAATETVDEGYLRYTVDTEAMTAEVYGPVSSSEVITDLVIPDYIDYNGSKVPVTSIRSNAFYYNRNLRGSLTIGNSVQTIGDDAFYCCDFFTGSLTIGESVETIGTCAFFRCDGFTGSLTIPNSVQTIEDCAFMSCRDFDGSLTIGNSVKTIGNDAFSECYGFTGELVIPESVREIGKYGFSGCYNFTSLFIKSQEVNIYYEAFHSWDNLQSVTCLATTPPPCIYGNSFTSVFATSNYSKPLYVPAQSVEAYKTATEWEKFTNINPMVIEPASLTLNKTQLELQVGETETLIATILPEYVTETELTWTSSNPQFADVSNDGTVTALAVGETTITVTTTNDLSATCKVTVIDEGKEDQGDGPGKNPGGDDDEEKEENNGNEGENDDGAGSGNETGGLSSIWENESQKFDVYNIQGTLLRKDCNSVALRMMPAGMYIIVKDKEIMKIYLR